MEKAMVMTVILLVPNYPHLYREDVIEPLGVMYLAASLDQRGHDVKIYDWNEWLKKKEVADWFGLSITTPVYSWAKEAISYLRAHFPEPKIVVGGPHATFLPEATRDDLKPDFVVAGEGEKVLPVLVESNAVNGNIIYSSPIDDLDSLPLPNHNLYGPHFPNSWSKEPGGAIMCSRGCPRSCSFCGPSMGKIVRWRSPAHVAAEILKSGLKQWRFVDDDLLMREDYLEELTFYLKRLEIEFRCSAHARSVTLKKLQLLREAGCKQVGYGIESGSRELLKKHKGTTPELGARAIKLTQEAGLLAQAYLIAGLPGEQWSTMTETIEWCADVKPDKVTVSTCTPYPGSDLYNNPKDYGITSIDDDFVNYVQLGREDKPLIFDTFWADRHELAEMRNSLRKALGYRD